MAPLYSAAPGKSQQLASPDQVPEGLAKSDWSSIRAAYEAGRHAFQPVEGQEGIWRARNPGQQWTTQFDQRGFLAQPKDGGWTWGLELQTYGFGERQTAVGGTPSVKAEGQRLSYQWDASVQEWFVNDQRGLEHGFTISQRPEADPRLKSQDSTLNFVIATRGSLSPKVAANAQGVSFHDADGATVLNYAGLKVWDADGKTLASRFEAAGEGRVRLRVEESTARYPITIDPIAQQAYLKASNNGGPTQDNFGWSVAVSGDTVVVGAYKEDSSTTGVNSTPDDASTDAGAAYVFTRSGTTWTQQAYLKASQVTAGDNFGYSVAVAGDTVVVGAIQEDSSTTGVNSTPDEAVSNSGAAFVFTRIGTAWTEQAYLKASQVTAGDFFGYSVAVSGDTVVVGANQDDSSTTGVNSTPDELATGAGAAYVFTRSGTTWTQQAYLKASQVSGADEFGSSVAVSGETVVVGAYLEDGSTTGVNSTPNESATDAGAAYVFTRSGTTWTQQAYLKASQVNLSDNFGWSVAVSGDTVVVGAHNEASSTLGVNSTPNELAAGAGAAYVFTRSGTTWTQQAYLKANQVNSLDNFGRSVAVSGDTVVVGAIYEDSSTTGVNSAPDELAASSGAAYVFTRSGTTWTQEAYLKASQVSTQDQFGRSVAVSGDAVVVGAYQEDSSTTGVNSTPGEIATDAGAAYVFTRSGTTWTQEAYLKASNTPSGPGTGDSFGYSVAVSGDTVVVGAYQEDSSTTGVNSTPDEAASNAGAAYVFTRSGTAWTQQAYLKASQVTAADGFGFSVAVSGETVVVGAYWEGSSTTGVNSTPNEGANSSGAAYVFTRSGTTWTQQAYLKASQVSAADQFGYSVAISGDTVVVGANGEDSSTTGVNSTPDELALSSGAAYVFTRSGTTWTEQAYLKASQVTAADSFGFSVAVSGETVVVGAYLEDGSTTGVNSTPNESATDAGAAYVFTRSGTTWTQQAYLKASQVNLSDNFGWSVAVSGDTVVVGANGEDSSTTGVNSAPDEAASNAGAAYVFTRSGTTWTGQAYLKASQVTAADQFGISVGVSGDTVVVGATGEDSSTTGVNSTPDELALSSGAVYVFTRSGTTWTEQAYLKASQVTAADQFGKSVAVSGDTVVVGAINEDSSSTGVNSTPNELAGNSGAAYSFAGLGSVLSAPTVTSVSPSSGSTLGGTSVTITGADFTGATGVTIGGTAASSVTVVDATTITATTPIGSAGTASVEVTTPGGTNAANSLYTYSNNAPVITSNSGGATAAISVAENTTVVTTVTATDVDAGQTKTYSISGGADSANFSINSSSGVLTFATAPNYEVPTDAGANNVYEVTVRIDDNGSPSLNDTQAISVTVTDANEAPVITSNSGGATATISVAENTTAVTTVTATDVDAGQTKTYSISGGADSAKFSINSSLGVLTFATAPNYEAPTDAGANNVYEVTVRIVDNGSPALDDTQAISVTVTDANEAPVITSNSGGATAAISVAENTTAVTTVTATDVDAGQTKTYSISGGADSAKFSINSSSGVLVFNPAPDFEMIQDANSDNVFEVIVRVLDNGVTPSALDDTQAISVTVTNVNEAPVITSNGGGATAVFNVVEGTSLATTVVSTDPDVGQLRTYSIIGGVDSTKFTIDPNTGALSFNFTADYELPKDDGANNVYQVNVQVSDAGAPALTDTQNMTITVTNDPADTPSIVIQNMRSESTSTTQANLVADINPRGLSTSVTFEYSTSSTFASGVLTEGPYNIGSGTSLLELAAPITGLTAGGTYYWRIVATNTSGTYTTGTQQLYKVSVMASYSQGLHYGKVVMNTARDVWGRVWGGVAPYTYVFDFGDGTTASGSVTDTDYIQATKTYTTAGSKNYTLKLTDANGSVGSRSGVIRVLAASTVADRAHMAMEKGLVYFYRNPTVIDADRKYWNWGSSSITDEHTVGTTGMGLAAFAENEHLPDEDAVEEIYAPLTYSVRNYLLNLATTQVLNQHSNGIAVQDTDSNDNTFGISFIGSTYADSIAAMAIGLSLRNEAQAKALLVPFGPRMNLQSMYSFIQDCTDQFLWALGDGPSYRGAFRYSTRTTSQTYDGSTQQWPALAVGVARDRLGISFPLWALDDFDYGFKHLTNSEGGVGYDAVNVWSNLAKTGGALAAASFSNKMAGVDADATAYRNYIAKYWTADASWSGTNAGWAGQWYAMYGLKKGLSLQGVTSLVTPSGSRDWKKDLNGWLLGEAAELDSQGGSIGLAARNQANMFGQLVNGSWTSSITPGGYGTTTKIDTAAAILILSESVTQAAPVAVISPIPEQSNKPIHRSFLVSGVESYHMDANSAIVEYLWDWDASNGVDWANPDASGALPTNPGYSIAGNYIVTLRVKDNKTPATFSTATTTVTASANDVAPIAIAKPIGGYDGYAGKVGFPITLTGTGSYDPDGDPILTYSWDFNGDGIYGDATDSTYGDPTVAVTTVIYTTPYLGSIGLRVTANGKTSSNTSNIDIQAGDADLRIDSVTYSNSVAGTSTDASIQVTNDGASGRAFNNVRLRLYNGDPYAGGGPIGTAQLLNFGVGETKTVSLINVTLGGALTLYAFLDTSNSVVEFNELNNISGPARLEREIAIEQPALTNQIDGSASVAFGTKKVAETSSLTFTVKSVNASVLTLGAITFTGTNATDFSVTTAPAASVAGNGSTTFVVTFQPRGSGSRLAVMHIVNDDTDENPFDITVTGTGSNTIGSSVPDGVTPVLGITGDDFVATGLNFETGLGFVPTSGQTYTFIDIVSPANGVIGNFNDLPDGGVVAMSVGGVIYYFQATYGGGSGNDLTITSFTPTAVPAWRWVAGPKTRGNAANFGTLNVAAGTNNPGGRQGAMNWRGTDGSLWMFGGYGFATAVTNPSKPLNDLWQFDRTLGQWIWRSGSRTQSAVGVYGTVTLEAAGNTPGARHTGSTWTDSSNNLWLFGGLSGAVRNNDLWRYNPGTGRWTWMKGSSSTGQVGVYGTKGVAATGNTPGARQGAASWFTPDGNLWLFGGFNGTAYFNDLWSYNLASGMWTWVSGSSSTNANGTYGTQGTAAAANTPGARRDATGGWVAADGSLWMFGGLGLPAAGVTSGDMNDLWRFNRSTNQWTWMNGSNSINPAGVYGTQGTPDAANTPGGRSAGSGWVTADGKFWLVGGYQNSRNTFADVWIYDNSSNKWVWTQGPNTLGAPGVYGTQGVPLPANQPGARFTPSTWVTLNGALWIFGGGGVDAFGSTGRLSDLWSYSIPPPPGGVPYPAPEPFPASYIINDNPSTSDASAGTMASVPVSGQLTGTDADGDIILFGTTGTTLSHGTLTLQSNGQWTYAPAPGYVGTDTFTFKASDYYGGQSPTRTLTITVATNPADADNDGIADSYELSTFGSTGADALGDADGDGQSNYFEYLAGTSPVDASQTMSAAPSIAAGASASGGSFKLKLSHVRPGVNYHLETSTDLDVWNRIGTFTFSVSGSATIEDPTPPAGQTNFYRVSLEAPVSLP